MKVTLLPVLFGLLLQVSCTAAEPLDGKLTAIPQEQRFLRLKCTLRFKPAQRREAQHLPESGILLKRGQLVYCRAAVITSNELCLKGEIYRTDMRRFFAGRICFRWFNKKAKTPVAALRRFVRPVPLPQLHRRLTNRYIRALKKAGVTVYALNNRQQARIKRAKMIKTQRYVEIERRFVRHLPPAQLYYLLREQRPLLRYLHQTFLLPARFKKNTVEVYKK